MLRWRRYDSGPVAASPRFSPTPGTSSPSSGAIARRRCHLTLLYSQSCSPKILGRTSLLKPRARTLEDWMVSGSISQDGAGGQALRVHPKWSTKPHCKITTTHIDAARCRRHFYWPESAKMMPGRQCDNTKSVVVGSILISWHLIRGYLANPIISTSKDLPALLYTVSLASLRPSPTD